MYISKIMELRSIIGEIILHGKEEDFPKTVTFSRSLTSPKYRITIEEIDEGYFIDDKGNKWVKAKNNEDEEINFDIPHNVGVKK